MSEVTPELVKQLREMTAVGVMECKKALVESDADLEKAADLLRRKGIAKAAKRALRETREGTIHAYIHPPGKIGVLLELNCETDFVARNQMFQELARDLAMHIAWAAPRWRDRDEVPGAVLEREREIYRAQAQGKPPQVVEKIVEGKVEKFLRESCLMDQAFVKDPDLTIGDFVKQKIAVIGENISLGRFVRFAIGDATPKD